MSIIITFLFMYVRRVETPDAQLSLKTGIIEIGKETFLIGEHKHDTDTQLTGSVTAAARCLSTGLARCCDTTTRALRAAATGNTHPHSGWSNAPTSLHPC